MSFFNKKSYTLVLEGLTLSFKGLLHSIQCPDVIKTYQSSLTILLSIIFWIYILSLLVYWPLSFFFNILVYILQHLPFFSQSSLQSVELGFSSISFRLFWKISFLVPLATVIVTQYIIPSFEQTMFFGALHTLDPELCNKLKQENNPNFWAWLWKRVKRNTKLGMISLIAYLLSLIPVVGVLVLPINSFFLTRRALGKELAVILSLALLTVLKPYTILFLKLWFSCRSLSFELLDIYFQCESVSAKKSEADNRPLLMGFSFPWMFVLSIPIVGPLFFGLAQASTAMLVINMI